MKKLSENLMLLFIVIFTGFLYFGYLGVLGLWNPDEPRYVEVAREMVSLKNFIIPHLNGFVYHHKPPMFFWSIAFFFQIFGETKEWIARLAPALSGFFTVIITYFYASKIFDKKIGALSALILLTSLNMFHLSRRCNIDTMFTLFILIAVILLHFGILHKEKMTKYFLLSCFFQGLGIITKGPLAFIFPFLTLIGYIFFTNNKEIFKKAPWFRGLIIILAVTAAWLLPAALAGGKEYFYAIVFKQTVSRYAHGMNHPRNFFYYFYTFPLDFLPWSLFFPLIFFRGILNKKFKPDTRLTWFFCWFIINFIFMCFSTEKRGLYLLPLSPAVAIFSAYYLLKFKFTNDKFFKIPFFILITALILSAVLFPVFFYQKTGEINVVLTVLSAICFWIGIFSLKFYKNLGYDLKLFLIAVMWGIGIFNVHSFLFPLANTYKSPKAFIQRMNGIETNWDNILFFNYYNGGFNFYLNRNKINNTRNINELKKYIGEKIRVIIVKKQSVKDIKKYLKNYKFLKKDKIGHRKFYIFLLKN